MLSQFYNYKSRRRRTSYFYAVLSWLGLIK